MQRAHHEGVAGEIAQQRPGQERGPGGSREPFEPRRAGKRRLEAHEGGNAQPALVQPLRDRGDVVEAVHRRAQHEAGHDEYAVVAAAIERAAHAPDRVLVLVHVGERRGVEAFEADEQEAAARPGEQAHVARVGDDVEGGAGGPAHAERRQRGAQLAQAADAAAYVVVVEADHLALVPRHPALQHALRLPHFRSDGGGGPRVEAGPERGERAELAAEGTAARGFQPDRHALPARYQVEARHRQARRVVAAGDVVRPQRPAVEVRVDGGDTALGVADRNRVEIRLDERRVGARERAAQHGFRAAPAPVVGDLARPVEVGMQARNEQEIVVAPPVRLLPGVVDHVHLHPRGQQCGDEGAYLGLEHAAMVSAAAVVVGEDGDDADAHGSVWPGARAAAASNPACSPRSRPACGS